MSGWSLRNGFSLIEIMVVLLIVSIMTALSFSVLTNERRDSEVQAEAERLAGFLRLARNRAMNEQVGYGVAFNIRNGLGTSGAVLNNWDGGHYYRMIGPDREYRQLPVAGPGKNFTHYLKELSQCWISEPVRLEPRRVRFLALSDLDRGPRDHRAKVYYASDDTYPRPWFGVYDPNAKLWWPWGGYDPSRDYSAFYYEGDDGDVVDSTNPKDRVYAEKSGEVNTVWLQGEGRPVVNADWLDACIYFLPSGEAVFLEWNLARRTYAAVENTSKKGVNGVSDRCLGKGDYNGNLYGNGANNNRVFGTSSQRAARNTEHPESQHFFAHTGGWRITLAPDATRQDNAFETVEEVIDSIAPAWRVEVNASGAVDVFRVRRSRSGIFLDERPTWPPQSSDWRDDNLIKERHITGWLHEKDDVTKEVGDPIIDRITGRMLTERIWWFGE